ncbi:MAG: TIGR03960 family B12-binding radical SAM protein [Desulfobacterales bacterium]
MERKGEILPFVNRPSRYLGTETNAVRKNVSGIGVHVALAFPDLYEIGSSHLGLMILYDQINKQDGAYAERVFAPDRDMGKLLREKNIALKSLETQTPLKQFDIVGFSLLYELNYTNMLLMLDLAGIPFAARNREDSFPIVIAGGPCTCNPEPVAEFFDAMVIGDGEPVVLLMCEALLGWKKEGKTDKESLLKKWSAIPGVYIPSHYVPVFGSGGFTGTRSTCGAENVRRSIAEDLDKTPFPESPVVAWSKPVHDRLRLEIARGCTRGCRFCQAGMIYRPVRERSLDNLLSLFDKSLKTTGYEDVSLLSLSTGDYRCIEHLLQRLNRNKGIATGISLPSIRAETLTPELMDLIGQVRKTGFTIAPEAGSQRLREVINKNLSEDDIVKTVTCALKMGWRSIKLYFMIGLPTETGEDLAGIVALVKRLRRIKTDCKKPYQISVSVATFIPKPHTPFQWARQIPLEESKEKIQWLRDQLRLSRVNFKWQNPEVSLIEGLWARGDRRLARLLIKAYQLGCCFDGWSDSFSFEKWQRAIKESRIDIHDYTRNRHFDEPLPWDHIDVGVSKPFLKNECSKALIDNAPTTDCRCGNCQGCGVCDFKRIYPRINPEIRTEPDMIPVKHEEKEYQRLRMTYTKEKEAAYLGHLEFVNLVLRAFRRAGILLKYSEGFHPKPKISFNDPLPLGIEGTNEILYATVEQGPSFHEMIEALNRQMPPGVLFKHIEAFDPKEDGRHSGVSTYSIRLSGGVFERANLKRFIAAEKFMLVQTNKKGKKTYTDLKSRVSHLKSAEPNHIQISVLDEKEKTIRPADFLRAVFAMNEDRIKTARIRKY